ncbi:hypothetical protein Btru_072975 [Bulinus truncatus]|nr:hypothetical protein Btru_072975 [Bulinus truncatus]
MQANVVLSKFVLPNVVLTIVVLSNVVLSKFVLPNVVLTIVVLSNVVLSKFVLPNVVLTIVVLSNVVLSGVVLSNVVLTIVVLSNVMRSKAVLCIQKIRYKLLLSKVGGVPQEKVQLGISFTLAGQRMERKHDNKVGQIEHQHENILKELQQQHDNKVRQIEHQHEYIVRELQQQHDNKVRQIEHQHENIVRELQQQHDNRVRDLQHQHNRTEVNLEVDYRVKLSQQEYTTSLANHETVQRLTLRLEKEFEEKIRQLDENSAKVITELRLGIKELQSAIVELKKKKIPNQSPRRRK